MKVIIMCIFAPNNKISDMPIIDFIRKKSVSSNDTEAAFNAMLLRNETMMIAGTGSA